MGSDVEDVGDPLGLMFGPSGLPLGAVPTSPLGETPGPRGTPFGADRGEGPWVDSRPCNSSHKAQCVDSSSNPRYGHGSGVVDSCVGEPLGLIPGPRGCPLGAVPVSPFGDTPGPSGTPFGAVAGSSAQMFP